MHPYLRVLSERLFAPIDIASLAFFRVCFGAIMLWEAWRFLNSDRIHRYFIEPEFFFKYPGFEWVQPWSGDLVYIHFYALGGLALCFLLGVLYRLSALLFFLGFTHFFLIDQTHYQNHYYLVCLLSLLMIFVPAHRALSLDARLFPRLRSESAPAWSLWLLRAQVGAVYFYGGIAKVNLDWLRGWPLRLWLPGSLELPLVSPLLDQVWVALFFSYAGLLIDLLAVPLLLWGRTRLWTFAVLVSFHFLNDQLFSIGIFPYLATTATLLFFPAGWPRRVFNWPRSASPPALPSPALLQKRAALLFMSLYLAFQALAPLRHWLYPGNPSWTEEGHLLAWHMKLRNKDGEALFLLTDPGTGKTWEVDPRDHLTRRQYYKMIGRPQLIVQFAHYLAEQARQEGCGSVQVRARVRVSLNGRAPQLLIDPQADLAQETWTWRACTWILPLDQSLPGR